MKAIFHATLFGVFVLGSCGPEKAVLKDESLLRCGMTHEEVGLALQRKLVENEAPRFWHTHTIYYDKGELWLGFKNDKLKFSQIAWEHLPTRMAFFQRMDLCGSSPPEEDLSHRLT